jgi:uncharacterized RDD family membrane protein YckC
MVGNDQCGPLSLEGISGLVRSGKVDRDSLSWTEGQAGWLSLVANYPSLFENAVSKPPPLPRSDFSQPSATPVQDPHINAVRGNAITDSLAVPRVNNDMTLASSGSRFIAGIIDAIVMAIGGGVCGVIIPVVGALLFSTAYIVFMMSNKSTMGTLGMSAMKLKVVNATGGPISLQQSIIRVVMSYISAAILMIGYLMMFFNNKKQTLHDKVAETYVVVK